MLKTVVQNEEIELKPWTCKQKEYATFILTRRTSRKNISKLESITPQGLAAIALFNINNFGDCETRSGRNARINYR
jgi:hypothetical protein